MHLLNLSEISIPDLGHPASRGKLLGTAAPGKGMHTRFFTEILNRRAECSFAQCFIRKKLGMWEAQEGKGFAPAEAKAEAMCPGTIGWSPARPALPGPKSCGQKPGNGGRAGLQMYVELSSTPAEVFRGE